MVVLTYQDRSLITGHGCTAVVAEADWPAWLDPEEHKKLIPTLRWERENLLETKRDAHTLSVHRLRELYGTDGKTLLAQVLPMLDRNDCDLQALQGGDA